MRPVAEIESAGSQDRMIEGRDLVNTQIRASIPSHVPAHLVVDFDIYALNRRVENPLEYWQELEQRGVPKIFYSPHWGGHWVLRSFASVQEAYRNWERFSNERAEIPHLENMLRLPPATVDPPAHQKFRSALNPYFGPARVRAREDHIRNFSISLIEPILQRDRCDFVADYARRLPTNVFLDLMGLPKERLPQFLEWEHDFFRGEIEAREAVFAKILAYLGEFYDWKAGHPGDDLATVLLNAKDQDGAPWTREELVNCSFLLFVAGLDTVVNTLSFIWRYLAEAPQARQYILQNPGKRQGIVEELLRINAAANLSRRVREDVELEGVKLKAGDKVLLVNNQANRDGQVFDDPLETRFDRNATQQLGFGSGIHKCVGMHLARMEIWITLEEWLKRIPDFSLDPEQEIQGFAGMVMGLSTLPLRLGPRT